VEWQQRKTTTMAISTLDMVFSRLTSSHKLEFSQDRIVIAFAFPSI
jgi:hypothetical protein